MVNPNPSLHLFHRSAGFIIFILLRIHIIDHLFISSCVCFLTIYHVHMYMFLCIRNKARHQLTIFKNSKAFQCFLIFYCAFIISVNLFIKMKFDISLTKSGKVMFSQVSPNLIELHFSYMDHERGNLEKYSAFVSI